VELTAPQRRDFLSVVLRSLVDFKSVPKYQFERRIDAFIAVFLPDILDALIGGTHELVTPEFPLKKAINNQSTNVDYLLLRRSPAGVRWVFFELKTDAGSFKHEQLATYRSAVQRGTAALLRDLDQIVAATAAGWKYANLSERLRPHRGARGIDIVYLAPQSVALDGSHEHAFTFDDLAELELRRHPEAWALFKQIVLPAFHG